MGFMDLPSSAFGFSNGFERVLAEQNAMIQNLFVSENLENVIRIQNEMSRRISEIMPPLTQDHEIMKTVSGSFFDRTNFAADFMATIKPLIPDVFQTLPDLNFLPTNIDFSSMTLRETFDWKSTFESDVIRSVSVVTDPVTDVSDDNREIDVPKTGVQIHQRRRKNLSYQLLGKNKNVYKITSYSKKVIQRFAVEASAYNLWLLLPYLDPKYGYLIICLMIALLTTLFEES